MIESNGDICLRKLEVWGFQQISENSQWQKAQLLGIYAKEKNSDFENFTSCMYMIYYKISCINIELMVISSSYFQSLTL